jgi:hypothetical protein
MKKGILTIALAASFFTIPVDSYAWGKKGHELVAEIAFHFLDSATQSVVKQYLGNLSIEEAANWMDDNRSNSYYDFQKPWHYFDLDKGMEYKPTSEKSLLTVLYSAINELKGMDKMKRKDIKERLLYIFHLMGDLHQPLHCAYTSDKGGNSVDIRSDYFSSNLHSAWDTQIIENQNIQLDDCLKLYDSLPQTEIDSIKQVNVLSWYKQSRSYLDFAYSFKNNYLDKSYIDASASIIKKQLLRGGIRLAVVLKELFGGKSFPPKG